MNTIDLVIVIVLIALTLLGLMRGFIQGLGSLIGLFVGFFVAGHFAWPVAHYIRSGFAQYPAIADTLSYLVAFFLIFFLVTFVVGILVKTIDKVFNLFAVLPFLKTINRLGGAFLGLIEGAFFIAAVVYMLASLPLIGLDKKINESTSGPFFMGLSVPLRPFLPDFATLDLTKLLPAAELILSPNTTTPSNPPQ